MRYNIKVKKYSIIHSLISGHNFYFYDSQAKINILKERKIVLEHGVNESKYYAEIIPILYVKKFKINYWADIIKKPVNKKYYIWPVDIIELSQGRIALVFPYRPVNGYDLLQPILSNLALDSHHHKGIDDVSNCYIVKSLLEAWCSLDDLSYSYHGFSYSNIYYSKVNNYDTLFEFSFSVYAYKTPLYENEVEVNKLITDYIDSYHFHKKDKKMDLYSEYFTMAVILFKLLIGLLPFQGRILEGEPNMDEEQHNKWITIYHNHPIFIFNELDKSNHLSLTVDPDTYYKRWGKLNETTRSMFMKVFETDNVLRKNASYISYPPIKWRESMESFVNCSP